MKKLDKTKKLIIIGVVTLLVTVIGGTYAYFSINASSTGIDKTNVTGGASERGMITMTTNISELYLKLSGAEMTENKKGTMYYATTTPTTSSMTSNYLLESDPHEFDLATFALDGGSAQYNCEYAYTVKAEVTGLTDEQLKKITKYSCSSGICDIKIIFENNNLYKEISLEELRLAGNEGVPLTGTIKNLTAGEDQTIRVYSSFENSTINQDAISGINYRITIEPDKENSFKCSVVMPKEGITADQMAANYETYGLLSSGLENDGYRYSGGFGASNYICFGIANQDYCRHDSTYRYQILGIFQEENGDGTVDQNSPYHFKLVKLNNNNTYTSEWENKIAEWNWTFTNSQINLGGPNYIFTNTEAIYMHEMNRKNKSNYQCSNDNETMSSDICKIGSWNYSKSKYGLLYVSDIMLSYGEETIKNKMTGYDLEDKENWLAYSSAEISTISKANDNNYYYKTRFSTTLEIYGELSYWSWSPYDEGNPKDTFYLTSDVKIVDGTGTESDPYIIEL